jgi:hypothetical protein
VTSICASVLLTTAADGEVDRAGGTVPAQSRRSAPPAAPAAVHRQGELHCLRHQGAPPFVPPYLFLCVYIANESFQECVQAKVRADLPPATASAEPALLVSTVSELIALQRRLLSRGSFP